MPRTPQSEILKRYRGELHRSKQWREHMGHESLWRRLIDLYKGCHLKWVTNEDRIIVNMAKATIDVIAPSVAINNPKIAISARREEAADTALIAEQLINYHWRHSKYQPQIRLAVNDALITGHGWVKVGYKYKAKEPQPAVADTDELDKTPAEDPEHAEEPCSDTELIVNEDRPFVERVSIFDMFVNPDARHPQELRWVCQRIRRSLADVKKDTSYKAQARKDAQASSIDPWTDRERQEAEVHAGTLPGGYVDVFEFYDLKNNTVCTFTDGGGESDTFLRPPKPIPFAFGNPFVMLRDYEVPDQFYPMGELEAIEILQYELNETRSQMVNHRRRYNPKWLYRRKSFEDDGMRALENDDYNTLVPVEDTHVGNLSDAVVPMPTTQVPPEFYQQSTQIQTDMDTISGVSDYMRGQMPEIRRTATEAAMLQDAQNARAADKLSRIESFLGEVAERVLQVLQQFTTGDQVFRVAGPNGVQVWVHYDRDYIQGEFDFEVEAGSTQPRNESFRRQSALQMVDALAPFAQIINQPKLVEYVLQYGFGVPNPGQFIMAPPTAPELPAPMADPAMPGEMAQGMQAPMEAPMEQPAVDPNQLSLI